MENLFALHKLIQSDVEEIQRLRTLATSLGGMDYTQVHVSGGMPTCKFEECIIKIMELEDKIGKEIGEYTEKIEKVRKEISEVKNPTHRLFLKYRYIDFLTYEEIAERMGYTVRQIYNIRKDCITFHPKDAL